MQDRQDREHHHQQAARHLNAAQNEQQVPLRPGDFEHDLARRRRRLHEVFRGRGELFVFVEAVVVSERLVSVGRGLGSVNQSAAGRRGLEDEFGLADILPGEGRKRGQLFLLVLLICVTFMLLGVTFMLLHDLRFVRATLAVLSVHIVFLFSP